MRLTDMQRNNALKKREKKKIPLRLVVAAEEFVAECRSYGLAWQLIPRLLMEVTLDLRRHADRLKEWENENKS